MKIKVLITNWNILGYQNLVKILNGDKCEQYIEEVVKEFTTFIINTDSEYIRKHIYTNCYYERLIDDEKQENKNKLEKGTLQRVWRKSWKLYTKK